MNHAIDHLSQRVADWLEQLGSPQAKAGGILALRGWALREEVRRGGAENQPLVESLDPRLGDVPTDLIPTLIEDAGLAWRNLLNDLDRAEDNVAAVGEQIYDVFFEVVEALILAEEAGGTVGNQSAAQQLFNNVIGDVYVFEPLADLAAQLGRWGTGRTRLSDLLCAAVAGLYGGEARHAVEVIETEPEDVAQYAPVERFVRGADSAERLTLEQFAHRLAASPWWYVKWAAQRVRMSVVSKTRELRLEVFDSDDTGEPGRSRGLDGWEVRLTHAGRHASTRVENAAAVLKLPDHVDARSFGLQVCDAAGREWVELFGRKV